MIGRQSLPQSPRVDSLAPNPLRNGCPREWRKSARRTYQPLRRQCREAANRPGPPDYPGLGIREAELQADSISDRWGRWYWEVACNPRFQTSYETYLVSPGLQRSSPLQE